MRRVGVVRPLSLVLMSLVLLSVAELSAAGPAAAVGKINLGAIVVDELPGYVHITGQGVDGPITKEQFIGLSADPARVRKKLEGRFVRIFGRTFVRQDGGRAIVLGFQFGRPKASEGFVAGVHESLAAKGPVKPVPGLTDGGRSTQPPSEQIPVPIEQVFFRSGRLGFMLTVTGSQTLPDPSDEAVRLAGLQADRVPDDIASERDIADIDVGKTIAILVGAFILAALVIALARREVRRQA